MEIIVKNSGTIVNYWLYVFVGSSRSHFPLVRRSVTVARTGTDTPPTRHLPKLMSLDLFNPETDDMDSDSSGVSSPDSVGSVISVVNEDDHNNQGSLLIACKDSLLYKE